MKMIDLNVAFREAMDVASYEDVLGIIESYEDESILDDFKLEFVEGEDISKDDYSYFSISLIDDISEVSYIQANWIYIWDKDIFEKTELL